MRVTWTQPEDLVAHELAQARAEGADISGFTAEWIAAGGDPVPPRGGASPARAPEARLRVARDLLERLDRVSAAAQEPDTWEQMLRLLPPEPAALPAAGADLDDRILAAWLGRAAACLLGKPVEKIPREGIRALLESAGRWPLTQYFSAAGVPAAVSERWPWNKVSGATSLVENIDGMPEDDDLNYPLLNLALLERHGRDFSTEDVARAWLNDLPAGRVFTAERIAYRNLLDGVEPGHAGRVRNPFREWIGALIRTDVYGWAAPGHPREAARMAWTDARLSHTRNGVYGAMWAAALTSASLVCSGVDEVLAAGLGVIPEGSDLARAVIRGAEIGRSGRGLDAELDMLHAEFGSLHWVHTVNNAASIAYALAASEGEFSRAAPAAVMLGWDTDSAGATVGSIAGALGGTAALESRWVDPLDNRIATSLPGMHNASIGSLAARTSALAHNFLTESK